MSSFTHALAERVIDITIDDMPKETINMTKTELLDSIGCALGAYAIDSGKIISEFVREAGGKPQASVIGGGRTSYSMAAFANGNLMNALDYEMVSVRSGHPAPTVIPPCIAMAERNHTSGRKLVEAITLGFEVADRVGSSVAQHYVPTSEPPHYKESDRFSQAMSIFGGVAGAGKIIGLTPEKMAHAFGIAGASMPVPACQKWEHNATPGIMVKYNSWLGWTSNLATVAVLLAEKGFIGDDTIFDGELGLWKIVASPYFKDKSVLERLGEEWHTQSHEIKPYPCCRANHPGIDAIIRIIEENEINPDEISEVVVKGGSPLMYPNRVGTIVRNSIDTQFINSYIFAVACYLGKNPGPGWQQPHTYNDPKIKSLMTKIKVEMHHRMSELLVDRAKSGGIPQFPDTIVEMKVGRRTYGKEITSSKGSRSNLLTEEELKAKFRVNTAYSPLSEKKTEEVINLCDGLEKIDDVTQLTRTLITE